MNASINIGATTTAEPDQQAKVENVGSETSAILNFTIPRGATGAKGETGEKGDTGEAETITIGNTTTGDAGTSASVTDRTGAPNHTLDFVIPRGKDASETAGYFVTLNGAEGIDVPAGGLEIASLGRVPISRKEMDTTNAFVLNDDNTISFTDSGTYEMTFVVNGVNKHAAENFDPFTHFASVGFRATNTEIIFVGANQWSQTDEPHQIVGSGMFVANDPSLKYELINLHNSPLYLYGGKKDNTQTVSYFTTPVATLRFRKIR